MISHKHKAIFVHIPKTSGTSIEDVIWPKPRRESELWMGFVAPFRNKYQTGGLQHLLARQIRQEVGKETFESYFKFTIVRNSWDKVISQYSFLRQREDLQRYLGVPATAPLVQYLAAAAKSDHVQVMSQVNFIQDENGEIIVDCIGRFENLLSDVESIFSRLGLDGVSLPHTKKSSRDPDYRKYYDDETREYVAEIYARDIQVFGFTF